MGGFAWLSIFGLGKASTREHIRSDLRPRSNATKVNKRRHPQDKSTLRRLAALLAPYRPMRVCASLAPCQPPQIALARSPPIYEMASHSFIAAAAASRIFRTRSWYFASNSLLTSALIRFSFWLREMASPDFVI